MIYFLAKKTIKNSDDVNNPQVREKYGVFAGTAGIIFNLLLCAVKIVFGILSGLVSLVGDGINNLSDAGSSIITMIGFKLSAKKHDADHPFGHGRIEYLTGLLVSVIILVLAIEIITSSIEKIFNPIATIITLPVIIVMGVAILVKFYMFLYNRAIAKKIDSASLMATATDSLMDCFATGIVLVCAIIGYYTNVVIDGYAGIVIGLFVLYAGLKSFKETVNPLLGTAPEKEYVQQIEDFVTSYPLVCGVHDLIVHDYGPGRKIISLHAEVPDTVSVHAMHDEIDNIEVAMYEKFGAITVIHADPIAVNDEETSRMKDEIKLIVSALNSKYSVHDVRLVKGETHSNVIFDLVITSDCKNQNEVVAQIKKQIKAIDEKYNAVIKVEFSFSGE